jgi:ankyrin repeat protein
MKPFDYLKESLTNNCLLDVKKALELISSEELEAYNKNNKLLTLCAKNYNKSTLTELLNHGLEINTQNSQKETILHVLLKQPNQSKFKEDFKLFLLDKGLDVNIKDNNQRSALSYLVAKANNVEEIKKIESHSQFDLNWLEKDKYDNNMIHLLIGENNNGNVFSVVDYCLSKGINIYEKNNLNNTALDVAICESIAPIVKTLINQYQVEYQEESLYNALNLLRENNFIEVLNAKKIDFNNLKSTYKIMNVCLSLNHLNVLKALSQTPIWTEDNLITSLNEYREQFSNIFEIDESTKNYSLEFVKVSLIYLEKERLERALSLFNDQHNEDKEENKKIKV